MYGKPYMLARGILDELLRGKVGWRLVGTLLGQQGRVFTVRKLAKAAGVSVSEAAVAVRDLEKHGVLTIQPVGKSYLIGINGRSYILNKIMRPALEAEERFLEELSTVLRKKLVDKSIISAVLFGSVVRGEARENSDIDLLVVSDDHEAAAGVVSSAGLEVASVFNGRLSPLIMGRKELKSRAKSKFIESVLANYTHVVGRDLRELTKG